MLTRSEWVPAVPTPQRTASDPGRISEPPAETDSGGAQVDSLGADGSFLCASPAMREVRKQVMQVAETDVPVLLLGESGTGKEVIARLIHKFSLRSKRILMKVNCAALPSELLESELFGHEAGAFTGANRPKPGKFEVCHRGTLLLDEIAEMPTGPQAKLLHVLQDGEFARLGSPSSIRVDVRVIAATNVNITRAMAAGHFREDLYYRLSTLIIEIPPLRDRREDIPALLRYSLQEWSRRYNRQAPSLSPALLDACLNYHWPGNVRELENVVRRYLIVGDEAQTLSRLRNNGASSVAVPAAIRMDGGEPGDLKAMMRALKQGAEREAIVRSLVITKGNRKEAAARLGISLRALFYKIREYEIDRPSDVAVAKTPATQTQESQSRGRQAAAAAARDPRPLA